MSTDSFLSVVPVIFASITNRFPERNTYQITHLPVIGVGEGEFALGGRDPMGRDGTGWRSRPAPRTGEPLATLRDPMAPRGEPWDPLSEPWAPLGDPRAPLDDRVAPLGEPWTPLGGP